MKRAKIGLADIDVQASYWSGGKDTHQLRCSELEIYAYIDLLQEESNISTNEDVIAEKYKQMDMYFACLQLIQAYGDYPDMLPVCGIVLNNAIIKGKFDKQYNSLDERNEYINVLIETLIDNVPNTPLTEDFTSEFLTWWKQTVIEQNYYTNPTTGEKSETLQESAAIGEVYDLAYYNDQIKQAGPYNTYIVASPENINTQNAMLKKNRQTEYLRWLDSCNVGLSMNAMKANIKSGVIAKTGKTPDEVVAELKTKNVSGIGEFFTVIAIISACIALLSGIIGVIAQIVAMRHAGDTNLLSNAPTEQQLISNQPTGSDWYGQGGNGSNTGNMLTNSDGSPNLLLYGGIAAVAAFLLLS